MSNKFSQQLVAYWFGIIILTYYSVSDTAENSGLRKRKYYNYKKILIFARVLTESD